MDRGTREAWTSTHNVGPHVRVGQHFASAKGGNDKVWDDGNSLDLLCPGELNVVADAIGRRGRLLASVDASRWRRQHLGDWDLDSCDVLRRKGLEIRADEATEEGGADVVRVSLCQTTKD
jgi:hypothetical protein